MESVFSLRTDCPCLCVPECVRASDIQSIECTSVRVCVCECVSMQSMCALARIKVYLGAAGYLISGMCMWLCVSVWLRAAVCVQCKLDEIPLKFDTCVCACCGPFLLVRLCVSGTETLLSFCVRLHFNSPHSDSQSFSLVLVAYRASVLVFAVLLAAGQHCCLTTISRLHACRAPAIPHTQSTRTARARIASN